MAKITQTDITAQNVSAGNLTVNNNYALEKSSLKKVIEKYTDTALKDSDFKGVIERLQHYMADVPSKVIGIQAKLVAADRQQYVRDAELLKEQFTKKLFRHQ